ncbi:MAG TPA: hypothetical protein VN611_11640 [Patescibacteria group bacterium]|nr:hypothetical protein [Patescibacteria group bacterium]
MALKVFIVVPSGYDALVLVVLVLAVVAGAAGVDWMGATDVCIVALFGDAG